jgi:hypothetical protein
MPPRRSRKRKGGLCSVKRVCQLVVLLMVGFWAMLWSRTSSASVTAPIDTKLSAAQATSGASAGNNGAAGADLNAESLKVLEGKLAENERTKEETSGKMEKLKAQLKKVGGPHQKPAAPGPSLVLVVDTHTALTVTRCAPHACGTSTARR